MKSTEIKKRVSAGEVLTMELLKALNNNAWTILMVKGQLPVINEVGPKNFCGKEVEVVVIPEVGINWSIEKFMAKFQQTMNAAHYIIRFI